MNEEKLNQNAERAYNYLWNLGCNKEEINKIANKLILLNMQISQKENKND